MAENSAYDLPCPGLVASLDGKDCLLMPLFPGEEHSIDLGPFRLTIRTPGERASGDSGASS